jgi:hypothetical protein
MEVFAQDATRDLSRRIAWKLGPPPRSSRSATMPAQRGDPRRSSVMTAKPTSDPFRSSI